jgi:hypothetical protein
MEKRMFGLLVVSFVLVSMFAVSVSALEAVDFSNAIDGVMQVGEEAFGPILGVDEMATNYGGAVFSKLLLVILVTLVVFAVLDQFNLFAGKRKTQTIIGIVLGILGTRFLPTSMLEAVIFPASALVAAISVGLPFIVYGVLVSKLTNGLQRRALWAVFGAIMFILMWYNPTVWITYAVIIIACILAFWFDGTLHKFTSMSGVKRELEVGAGIRRSAIVSHISLLRRDLSVVETEKDRRAIMKKIANQEKALKAI